MAGCGTCPGLEAYHGKDVYLTEALTAEALKAVDAAVAEGQPFYLHFAPYAVHAPIEANERYLGHYEGLDPREAAYATMVESVDVALGALVAELERLGLEDETVIVFTSDNGGLSAHGAGRRAAHPQRAAAQRQGLRLRGRHPRAARRRTGPGADRARARPRPLR